MKNKFRFPEKLKNKIIRYNSIYDKGMRVLLVRSTYVNNDNLAIMMVSEKYDGDCYTNLTTNLFTTDEPDTAFVKDCNEFNMFLAKKQIATLIDYVPPIESGYNIYRLWRFDLSKTISYEEYRDMFK